jgi:hypothetical protein
MLRVIVFAGESFCRVISIRGNRRLQSEATSSATLAQLVEHRFCKPAVVSSNLTGGFPSLDRCPECALPFAHGESAAALRSAAAWGSRGAEALATGANDFDERNAKR